MNMVSSSITSKGQTTIPLAVRKALKVAPGDVLEYRIERDRVIVTKASPSSTDDPFALFSEWSTDADAKAFAHLQEPGADFEP